MKKIVTIIVLVSIFVLTMSVPAFATSDITTEYYPDGSYLETTIETVTPSVAFFSSTSTKSASKTTAYKNSSGDVIWYVKVEGKFTYNGSTSSCTSSAVVAVSNSSFWKITSKSASKSGSTATANAVAKQYDGNTYIGTISKTVKLTCDKNGNLS